MNNYPISCVQIIDLHNDGTGGYASVIGGGIGKNWTEVLMTSQPGRNISFNITVFVSKTQPLPVYYHPPRFGWNVPPNRFISP